jgi:hypothetical protein
MEHIGHNISSSLAMLMRPDFGFATDDAYLQQWTYRHTQGPQFN